MDKLQFLVLIKINGRTKTTNRIGRNSCAQKPALESAVNALNCCVTRLTVAEDVTLAEDLDYKVALLTFKGRSTSAPSYLRLLIQDREHGHNLRSTTTTLCRRFTTTTFAKRAFRCSAPALWNSLPKTVLNRDSVAVFKSRPKTFLFSQAFASSSAH